MEAKLKSLKVVDLKALLTKANVSPPAKANKSDLISRILGSPAAIDVYHAQYPSESAPTVNDDLLAPPEDLDWSADEVPSSKVEEPEKVVAELATPTEPVVTAELAPAPAPPPTEDAEMEKRKQRAARFGIPLVEPKAKPTSAATKIQKSTASGEVPDKLKERADRFGIKSPAAAPKETSPGSKRKRTAPVVEVDPEESERRRKRAERFGIGLKPVT